MILSTSLDTSVESCAILPVTPHNVGAEVMEKLIEREAFQAAIRGAVGNSRRCVTPPQFSDHGFSAPCKPEGKVLCPPSFPARRFTGAMGPGVSSVSPGGHVSTRLDSWRSQRSPTVAGLRQTATRGGRTPPSATGRFYPAAGQGTERVKPSVPAL